MIPRTVHQTWKDAEFTYWVFRKSQASVRASLPGWDYRFWTDAGLESFVREFYSGFYPAWADLRPAIKRVDVARYFLLHRFGGIYADLDFIFTGPVETLFDDTHRLYFYRSQQAVAKGWAFLGNAFMASAAGESFWMELSTHMLSLPADTPVLHHTGPRAIGDYCEGRSGLPPMRIFGPEYFDNDRCGDGVGEHRYGYHMRTATWQYPGFEA